MRVGTIMLKSLYEGYIPCILLAALGFNTLGGSLLGWATFVWLFGAVLTIIIAVLRTRPVEVPAARQPVAVRIENC